MDEVLNSLNALLMIALDLFLIAMIAAAVVGLVGLGFYVYHALKEDALC